ncbi:MAG: amidase [Actinobacteria bacterium]|jgi:amidase|nr:amidase [Actinomycetota bacterium]
MLEEARSQLSRISKRDDVVKAWVARHEDAVILDAVEGAPPGSLHGWTIGVKDVIDTADLPTERGSPIYANRWTGNDAACVAGARAAGAVVLGKTVTTEFALFTPNKTTNPHNPDRTPGGSSSGSAAAVADNQVRAAFGTQTVGSVLRPAAYCGVVGFKPTYQLVPTAGVATLSHSFDTVGWFTKNVTDSKMMFSTLVDTNLDEPTRIKKIGRYLSHQWEAAKPEMAEVMRLGEKKLSDAGIEVVNVDPLKHLAPVFEAANTVLHYEVVRVFAWERKNHADLISPLLQKMLLNGDKVDHRKYRAAQLVLLKARNLHDEFMSESGLDALITPSASSEAPSIGTTGDSVFNRVWTALGVPAIHLPTGKGPLGLPVGVQLTGSMWGDNKLLGVANEAEKVFGVTA